MKRILSMMVVMLAMSCMLPVSAQQTQDALYIYRNDGGFCAFFFGDINHIEYSKTDTLGVEQPDYVVQEIYALDSVFRIPISAIDSVAFVTPETKIKADVFCPDKSIVDYIVASDSVYWIRLAKNTPTALIPKVGNKLLIEEESKFIPDGFGGLVTAVEEESDGIKVTTSAIAITDIYEQLVIKVAGASPDMKSAQTSRRSPLEGVDIVVPEEEITIPTVTQTIALKKSQALLPDNSYVELNGEIQGSVSATVNAKVRLRAFLTITPFTGFRYYQESFIDTETEYAATLAGGLSGRLEVPFLPAPTHTFKKNKLKIELGLGLFLDAQATALSLGFKNTKVQRTRVHVTVENKDVSIKPFGLPVFDPYIKWSSVCEKDTTEWEFNSTGQYTLGFGAFAKAEAKFAIPLEKLPKFVQAWTKTDTLGFKAALGVDAGSKLEYTGPLLSKVPTDLLQTTSYYKELNGGNLAVSAYLKFIAAISCGSWALENTPEIKLWEPINRGLVPDITDIKISQDLEMPIRPYRLLFSATTSNRKVLTGNKVGFALFDANHKLEKDSLCAFYWVSQDEEDWTWRNKTNAYDAVFKIDPGKDEAKDYVAYPMIEYMGNKLLADKKFEFQLDPARIDIAEREVFLGKDLGMREIEVVPNMENMEVKAEADWLREIEPSWLPHKNQLTIYWPDLPQDVKDRRGVIRLTGKSHSGETLVVDSIVVVQFDPFLELTPDKLEFSEKGGTQTVTIGKTNVTDLKVSTNSEDITATLKDKTITVSMGKNTTDQQRGGFVYVEGKTPNNKTVKFGIYVSQKEGKPIPQGGGDLELSVYSVESSARGEEFVIDVLTENVKNISVKVAEDSPTKDMLCNVYSRWINDHYAATFKTQDNTTREDRYAIVMVTAALADGSTKSARIVIYQEGYFGINRVRINPDIEGATMYDGREITRWFKSIMDFPESPRFEDDYCSHTTTINADGSIHFEASEAYRTNVGKTTLEFSFDLPGGLDAQVLNNLVIKRVDMYDGNNGEEDILFKGTNIPIKNVYETSSLKRLTFEGTEDNGAIFSELVIFDGHYGGSETYLLKHGSNKITLQVDLSTLPPYYNYPW